MGWAGAVWAAARLRPLGHVPFLPALAGRCAGSHITDEDATHPFTSVEENFGRLVGHDREPQLGAGRDARRIAHLARASKDFHYFTESRFTNARWGGVQFGDHLGIDAGAQFGFPMRGALVAAPSANNGTVFHREPSDLVTPKLEIRDPAVGAEGRRFHPECETLQGPLMWLLLP